MTVIVPKSVKSALTKTGGFLYSYTHTLQPYTGCTFGTGCGMYCYVPSLPIHQYASQGLAWGEYVYPKENIAELLASELAQAAQRGDLPALRIFMSSATDPYQPLEHKLGLSRACLEVFNRYQPGLLVIQTRSPLVRRDFPLIAALGDHAWLSLTIETDDDAIIRQMTPNVPSLTARMRVAEQAKTAGLKVQVAVSPMLPLAQPDRFADWLATVADRVIVDTFVSGDGSQGKRTAGSRLPLLWRELGYSDWQDETAAQALYQLLLTRLGSERVGWSAAGFNRVPVPPLPEQQLRLPTERPIP
jgi:DNA repair photolyase